MNPLFDFVIRAVFVGIGATLVMDAWGLFQKHVLNVQPLNYCLFGRWIGHLRHGQFVHVSIAQSARVRGECRLGWSAHYGIGIAFAGLLLALWGIEWTENPTPGPALTVGIATIVAPFFLLQPGMGAGIAASKTPHPNTARLRSVITHTIYGAGLYLSGCLWAFIQAIRV